MDDIPRLPPPLRTKSKLEQGLLIAGFAFVIVMNLPLFYRPSLDAGRVVIIVGNLGLLCFACAFAVRLYSTRLRQPDKRPLPFSLWWRLIGATALVALLPICAIVLALAIPDPHTFVIVVPISLIGVVVWFAAYLSIYIRRRAVD